MAMHRLLLIILVSFLRVSATSYGQQDVGVVELASLDHGDNCGRVQKVIFSPNGKMIATNWVTPITRPAHRFVTVWSSPHQKHMEIEGSYAFAFSQDGKTLAVGEELWSLDTKEKTRELSVPNGVGIKYLAYSPDGRWLAGGGSGGVAVWDARTYLEKFKYSLGFDIISALDFSFDGEHLAVGGHGDSGFLHVTSVVKEAALKRLRFNKAHITSVKYGPKRAYVISGDRSGVVRIHGFSPHEQNTMRPIEHLAVAPDSSPNDMVFAVCAGHYVKDYNVTDNYDIYLWRYTATLSGGQKLKRIARIKGHHGRVRCLAFHPEGRILASASEDRTVKLWSIPKLFEGFEQSPK